jgi:DNA repair protein RadC
MSDITDYRNNGTTTIKFVSLKVVREKTKKYIVSSKNKVAEVAKLILEDSAHEKFLLLGLNNQNEISVAHITEGEVDSCPASIQGIFKILLLSNSRSFVVAHCHPGGSLNFSSQDIVITKRLKEVAVLMGLAFLDHVLIVDGQNPISLREINPNLFKE